MTTATLDAPVSLTKADRCDRCGAEAQARAVLTNGDLLFCGHHLRSYEATLVEQGAAITKGEGVYAGTPGASA